MKYDYLCNECQCIFEAWCTIAERTTPKPCPVLRIADPKSTEESPLPDLHFLPPDANVRAFALSRGFRECPGKGAYDAASTLAGGRIIIDPGMNDLKGCMDKKYGSGRDANGYQGGQRTLTGGGGSYFAGDPKYEKNWHSGADS